MLSHDAHNTRWYVAPVDDSIPIIPVLVIHVTDDGVMVIVVLATNVAVAAVHAAMAAEMWMAKPEKNYRKYQNVNRVI